MFLSLIIAVHLFFVFAPKPSAVLADEPKEMESPIAVRFDTLNKLSENLLSANFAPLELKKALKVLSATSDLESLFDKYSSEYSVDKNLLKKIANCESHFNSTSRNGDYGGMFQFSSGTWSGTRAQMGQDGNTDLRFSAEEAIKTAAFKISRGGSGAWPTCSK